jgi:hypothetical protein
MGIDHLLVESGEDGPEPLAGQHSQLLSSEL